MGADAHREPGNGPHLLLYDGVCGLCNGIVQGVVARDRAGVFHFAALQSAIATEYLTDAGTPPDLSTFVLIPDYRQGRRASLTRSEAALFLLDALGWPWRMLAAARVLPRAWRDRLYDVVARHRYGVFGQVDHCLLPPPDRRERFLDQP